MGLEFDVLYYLMNSVIVAEMVYTYCRVLDMRSNAVFIAIVFASMNLTYLLQLLEWSSMARFFLLTIPTYVAFPIAFARDPLGKRLLWAIMVPAVFEVTDAMGSLSYYLFTGAQTTYTSAAANTSATHMTYMVLLFVSSMMNIGIIAVHDRVGTKVGDVRESSVLPIVALLLWFHILPVIASAIWSLSKTTDVFPSPDITLYCIALFDGVLSFVILHFVLTETKAQHMQADAAALVRQTKHMRAEILSSAKQSVALRRLRHDLAAQVDIILNLQQSGDEDGAMERLRALQNQAKDIAR